MKNIYSFRATMVAIIIFCSVTGWATDRYVSTTGNNTPGGGTSSAPWRTISYAILRSVAGDVIHVAAGTYVTIPIVVSKSLTIQGDVSNRNLVIIVPAAEDGNVDNAFANSAQNAFVIKAHNVTIEYLTINGRGNPALIPGKNNFRAGIVTLDPSQAGGGVWNNLRVNQVFIKHTWRRGISVFPRSVSGTLIENTRIDSVAYNQAMYLAGQAQALNNTINRCFQGIVFNPDGTTPAGLIKATGNVLNRISSFRGCWGDLGGTTFFGQPRGLEFNNTLSPLRSIDFTENTLTNFGNNAVGIYTVRADRNSAITGNIISFSSSGSMGMHLGWSYDDGFLVADNVINVTGTGSAISIFSSGSLAAPMRVLGNTLTASASSFNSPGSGTGVVVANQNLYNVDTGPSFVTIEDNNIISGFTRGVDVLNLMPSDPLPLSVTITNNDIMNNTAFGVLNNTGSWVVATQNWWGSCTGPFHATLNPAGLGNPVSDFVAFSPWEAVPDPAGPVTGPEVLYLNQTAISYSISPVPHATGYVWTMPPGVSITWGDGTNSILVDVSGAAVSGTISVYAVNPCGNGTPASRYITVLALPVTLPLNNITVESGQSPCYSATQTITVGGAAGPYAIETGGEATMIAGNNIRLLYGTSVAPGGYLHGFISTNGMYCGQQSDAPAVTGVAPPENMPVSGTGDGFFRVYPNPTRGNFTVELSKGEEDAGAVIRVYGLMGKLVLEQPMTGLSKEELSLGDNPCGIYVVKVMKTDKVGTVKVIRQQ